MILYTRRTSRGPLSTIHYPLIAFATVAALLVITPGVGTTFLISTVVGHGRRAGYLTAVGMICGAILHATIAAVGTVILLHRFPRA